MHKKPICLPYIFCNRVLTFQSLLNTIFLTLKNLFVVRKGSDHCNYEDWYYNVFFNLTSHYFYLYNLKLTCETPEIKGPMQGLVPNMITLQVFDVIVLLRWCEKKGLSPM
jgi:hypothetical protein